MHTASAGTSGRSVCAICLEEFLPDANISKLNCNHQYHQDCLKPWLDSNHNTCPLDRVKITSINGIATEHAEAGDGLTHVHGIEVENPIMEARTLYQRSIVILNPSVHSTDPVERSAARVQSIVSSIFRLPYH